MRIAVASSGLGHVARGIETWALDTAVALHERGVDVTLFAAGEIRPRSTQRHGGEDSGDMGVSAPPCPPWLKDLHVVVLPSLRRSDLLAKRLARMTPGFAWRWGLKSDYGWEQFSFWWKLWPRLKQGGYDILHVQDPMLAYWCRKLRRMGLLQTKEILAHGTEESIKFLEKFDYVQHLAPWHLREALEALRARAEGGNLKPETWNNVQNQAGRSCYSRSPKSLWTAIPNFVDTERFAPARTDETADSRRSTQMGSDQTTIRHSPFTIHYSRERFGLPPDAFVVGTVAAVKKQHKRIDYLVREFAGFANRERQLPVVSSQLSEGAESSNSRSEDSLSSVVCRLWSRTASPFLLICGARTDESDELVKLAGELCPGRVKFLFDVSREDMPDVYRAMDVFVLPSLFEMMPIALLEALASGLPAIVNEHPVLQWISGARGKGQGARGPTGGEDGEVNSEWKMVNSADQTPQQQAFLNYSPFTIHYSQSACREAAGAAIDMSREGELAGFLAGLTQAWMRESGRAARARAEALFSKDAIIDRYRDYYNSVAGGRRDAPMARRDGNRRSSTTNAQHRTSNIEHRTPNQEPRTKNQEPTRVVAFTKDWDDVPTCTTHILRELAKTMPVLWVNSIGTRRPSPGHSGDIGRAMKRLTRAFKGVEWKETNLRVLSPLLVPRARSAAALWLNRLLFAAQARREMRRMGNGQLEYWCFVPNAVDLLPRGQGTTDYRLPTTDYRPQTTLLRPLDKARGFVGQADDGLQTTDLTHPRILVVYYCVDDWSRFENLDTAWISGRERKMISRADVIFTPSRFLAEKCRGQPPSLPRQSSGLRRPGRPPAFAFSTKLGATAGRPTTRLRLLDKARGYGGQADHRLPTTDHKQLTTDYGQQTICHMPHGVQYDMFAAALDEETKIPDDISKLPKPVVGFYGNIYPWIDFKLVESLAKARTDWSFVMIGQVYCDVSPIANLPNVFLLGRREHAILPNYCKGFAAAIIPYDMTHPRMQSVNPVKLLELLAAGVPVVSADLPDVGCQIAKDGTADKRRLTQMSDVIMCSTPDGWLAALEKQVARTDRREISRRAAGNDWSDRVRMMRGVVDSERMFPTNHTNLHE